VRPAREAGRLLEPVSDCWPRGMIATRKRTEPGLWPNSTSYNQGVRVHESVDSCTLTP